MSRKYFLYCFFRVGFKIPECVIEVKKKVLINSPAQFRLCFFRFAQSTLNRQNMNVIITGATKGMGLAIAERFAESGYNIVTCARSKEDLDKFKGEFTQRFPGITVETMMADVGNAN